MKIDVRAIAEEQNWFVSHHWADGLELTLFGLPIGPILAYNLLQVANHHWLDQWDEEAARLEASRKAQEAARAQEASRTAQEAGSGALTEPNPPVGPSSPATPQPDPATAGVEALAAPADEYVGEEAPHGA